MGNLSSAEYRALAEIRYRLRKFLAFSEQMARSVGLEPQHHQLLLAIKGLPAGQMPTIGTLAERMVLKHHSMVELVDRVEERGLVKRRPSEKDRRIVHVLLTPEGESIIEELSKHHRDEFRSIAPTLIQSLSTLLEQTSAHP